MDNEAKQRIKERIKVPPGGRGRLTLPFREPSIPEPFLFGNFRPGGPSQALIVERTPSDRRGAIFNFKDIADYSALLQCAAAHTHTGKHTV